MVTSPPLRSGLFFAGLVSVILLFSVGVIHADLSGVKVQWMYPSGYDPHGGYIDRLTFVVYPSEDIAQALLALQSGAVYSYDERIPHQAIAELEANPAIEVSSEGSGTYRQFALNCQRFPSNITGYRVALAYALDKYATVQNSQGGYARVMDNPIPLAYEFWSYENQMATHFYDQDIAIANATLDAAHIIDPVDDPNHPHPGWRFYDADMSGNWTQGDKRGDVSAPEGLKTELLFPYGWTIVREPPLDLRDGMELCGLHAEILEVDFRYLIEVFGIGEYDVGIFDSDVRPPGDPILLYDFFHSESHTNAFFYRYNNSEYDYNCTMFMHAPTRLEARNWAWNCCRILMEDMPMIVCYNRDNIHAYRVETWEGYVDQVGIGRMCGNPYTYQSIRLKDEVGGPFGCIPTEYVTVLSEGMDSTNILLSDSGYTQTVFNQLYSTLWKIDPLDPLTALAPDLAYTWTLETTSASGDIQEGMKYTFNLYENISWHDGTPFTSEDVQYSFMNIHPLGPYTADKVASIYRVDTPDNYTVEIYSDHTGYVTFTKATSIQILPKHIWSSYEAENFTWIPETPLELTGTNCYQWLTRVAGQYIVLERYAGWHFAVEHPPRIPCRPNGPPPIGWIAFLIAVIVMEGVILGILLYRPRQRGRVKTT